MNALRSMRARVAALVVLAVALALVVVGAVVVESFARREHQALDARLRDQRPAQLARSLRRARMREDLGSQAALPAVLRRSDTFARVVRDGRTLASVDAPEGLPVTAMGLRTVRLGGHDYRVLTRRSGTAALAQVGTDLAPTRARIAGLRTRVVLISAVAVALAGILAWWLAGLALGPLRRLRTGAEGVSTTGDLSRRLPAHAGVEEIDSVSASVNAMLGRLERSAADTDRALAATRRFAADAGHEVRTPLTALRTTLAVLARNPDLPAHERQAALAEAEADAVRAARLLGALQLLARGDVGASLPRDELDLGELLDLAVERAGRRHAGTRFTYTAPASADPTLSGWADGLGSALDNLLDNAALHGRPGGRVEARLSVVGGALEVVVDDDGPGVPEEERERLFGRFERGATGAPGSGLGLALVRQQARMHGGTAAITTGPLGGARVTLRLARGAQPTSELTTAS